MESVLLVIHMIVALAIIGVVLVQPSEAGGFLGSGGSMSNLTAPRRKGDALTRATTILAGLFFLTSLALAIIAEHRAPTKSILDVATDTPAAESLAPAPDDATLKKVDTDKGATNAPAEKPAAQQKKKPTAPLSK